MPPSAKITPPAAATAAGAPPAARGHAGGAGTVISIRDLQVHCANCSVRELCLSGGFDADEMRQIETLVKTRRRGHRGGALYRRGSGFAGPPGVPLGPLKATLPAEDGREQVSGYHMQGDIVGFDGIGTSHH